MSNLTLADLVAVPFSAIPASAVEPLWPGWIARRHVTLVVAPGGTGKGMWTCDIIAHVTTGKSWPGEPASAVREPEAVVLVAPEDDPNEAVAWRLQAAGADSSLVFNLTVLPDGSPFILPDSVPQLTEAMSQITLLTGRKVGLVVIDPLMATVEKSIASDIAARKVVSPLQKLAKDGYSVDRDGTRTQVPGPAVILTHHTVKSGAVAGSKGLTNAMRHVLRIERPAGAEPGTTLRVVTVEKSNMAGTTSQLRYSLAGDGDMCHVSYPLDEAQPAVSRGYDITAALPGYTTVKAPAGAVAWRVVLCEQGGKPQVLARGFQLPADAQAAAVRHAGHALPWKDGDHGSQYAATVLSGGKMAAYTIFADKE
jgi:AAA domain